MIVRFKVLMNPFSKKSEKTSRYFKSKSNKAKIRLSIHFIISGNMECILCNNAIK